MSLTRVKQDCLCAIEVRANKFRGAETIHSSRSARFASTARRWWPHKRTAEALASAVWAAGPPLLFGLRMSASVSLARYVAFQLELADPYWAATSASIVCQPQVGASLRKGWFRMIGTLVGAVGLGAWTRPLALYTLGTALVGHPFWALEGADRDASAINFYKNISIIGGFLLLYVTGPGKYSLDAMLAAWPHAQARSV